MKFDPTNLFPGESEHHRPSAPLPVRPPPRRLSRQFPPRPERGAADRTSLHRFLRGDAAARNPS